MAAGFSEEVNAEYRYCSFSWLILRGAGRSHPEDILHCVTPTKMDMSCVECFSFNRHSCAYEHLRLLFCCMYVGFENFKISFLWISTSHLKVRRNAFYADELSVSFCGCRHFSTVCPQLLAEPQKLPCKIR